MLLDNPKIYPKMVYAIACSIIGNNRFEWPVGRIAGAGPLPRPATVQQVGNTESTITSTPPP
jgi:hypothetical protein